MNASEIKTRISDLEKASKDNLPADKFIDILASLQKEVKITEKLLRVRFPCFPPFMASATYTRRNDCRKPKSG